MKDRRYLRAHAGEAADCAEAKRAASARGARLFSTYSSDNAPLGDPQTCPDARFIRRSEREGMKNSRQKADLVAALVERARAWTARARREATSS